MVEALEELRDAWEEHQETMSGYPDYSGESPDLQRILAQSTMRSKFTVALPRLLDYERMYGEFQVFEKSSTASKFDGVEKTVGASA